LRVNLVHCRKFLRYAIKITNTVPRLHGPFDLDECFVASEKLYTCAASVEISYVYDHFEKIVFPPA